MANGEIVEVLVRGAAVGGFLGLAIAVGRGGASSARVIESETYARDAAPQ